MKQLTIAALAAAGHRNRRFATLAALAASASLLPAFGNPPAHEPAYVNGHEVIVSVKDPFPGKPAAPAQNQYFEVIYPIGWESLTDNIPQCNPCDHEGDGDDFFDYHDHVFAGEPSQPGSGAYGPLWALAFVVPAYTGSPDHDAAVSAAYASSLPVTSVQGVFNLLAATLEDGSPVAETFGVDYVFLAAIVNAHAEGQQAPH